MAVALIGMLAPLVLLKLARFLEEEAAVPPADRRVGEAPPDADRGDR